VQPKENLASVAVACKRGQTAQTKGNDLLQNLQLAQAELGVANPVRRNLENILEER
jgi:hypothetical protein